MLLHKLYTVQPLTEVITQKVGGRHSKGQLFEAVHDHYCACSQLLPNALELTAERQERVIYPTGRNNLILVRKIMSKKKVREKSRNTCLEMS